MSKIQLSPYVNFASVAREAMEFYQKALGVTLELYTMGQKGESEPARPGDHIAYAKLDADGALIIASDGHPKFPAKVGENLAIALSGTDKDRVSKMFQSLPKEASSRGR